MVLILYLLKVKIVNGVSETEFNPDGEITRQEAAAMLMRVYKNYAEAEKISGEVKFSDDEEIASWAKEDVYSINSLGIMQGVGANSFAPADSYTREQSVATIMRMEPYFVPVTSISLTQILDSMREEGDTFSLEIETDKVSFGESYTIEFVNDEGLDASDITAREPEIRLSGFPLEVSSDAGVTIVEDIRVEYEYDIDDKIYEADIYICGTTEIKSYMGPKFSWELTDEDGNVIAKATTYATTTDIVDKDTGEFCIDPSGATKTKTLTLSLEKHINLQ